MQSDYKVPASYGIATYIDKKSEFIGHVKLTETVEEAMAFVNEIRKKHANATHNVWAYHLKDGSMRWSDDGEPGGTSGQPTLNVFRSQEVYNVTCVTTRYFGGILLGSGGLVRAYSKAATLGLEAAGVAVMREWVQIGTDCSYSQYERVQRLLNEFGAINVEPEFGANVCVLSHLLVEDVEKYEQRLVELSSGTATVTELDREFLPMRIG